MSKPTSIPGWCTTGTRVEPPVGQKASGWTTNQIPPSTYENWRAGIVGDWITWLDTVTYERAFACASLAAPIAIDSDTETPLMFDTQVYDIGSCWLPAPDGFKLKAPYTGYYHYDFTASFAVSALTNNKMYICLRDPTVAIVSASSYEGDAALGHLLSCSIDVYLTTGQWLVPSVYQKNATAAVLNCDFARASWHRFG